MNGEDILPGLQGAEVLRNVVGVEAPGIGLVAGVEGRRVPGHRPRCVVGLDHRAIDEGHEPVVPLHAQFEAVEGTGIRHVEGDADVNAVVAHHLRVDVGADQGLVATGALVADSGGPCDPAGGVEGLEGRESDPGKSQAVVGGDKGMRGRGGLYQGSKLERGRTDLRQGNLPTVADRLVVVNLVAPRRKILVLPTQDGLRHRLHRGIGIRVGNRRTAALEPRSPLDKIALGIRGDDRGRVDEGRLLIQPPLVPAFGERGARLLEIAV